MSYVIRIRRVVLSILLSLLIASFFSCTMVTKESGSINVNLTEFRSVTENQTFIVTLQNDKNEIVYNETITGLKLNIYPILEGRYTLTIKTPDNMYIGRDDTVVIRTGEVTKVKLTLVSQMEASIKSVEKGIEIVISNFPSNIKTFKITKTYTDDAYAGKTLPGKEIITLEVPSPVPSLTILDDFITQNKDYVYTVQGLDSNGKTIVTTDEKNVKYTGTVKNEIILSPSATIEFNDQIEAINSGTVIDNKNLKYLIKNHFTFKASNNDILTYSAPDYGKTSKIDMMSNPKIVNHFYEPLKLIEYSFDFNHDKGNKANYQKYYYEGKFHRIINHTLLNDIKVKAPLTLTPTAEGMKVSLDAMPLPSNTTSVSITRFYWPSSSSTNQDRVLQNITLPTENPYVKPDTKFTFLDKLVKPNSCYYYQLRIYRKNSDYIETPSVSVDKKVLATGGSGDIVIDETIPNNKDKYLATYSNNKLTLKAPLEFPFLKDLDPNSSFSSELTYLFNVPHKSIKTTIGSDMKTYDFTVPLEATTECNGNGYINGFSITATVNGIGYKSNYNSHPIFPSPVTFVNKNFVSVP